MARIQLSSRLSAVAERVLSGRPLADVGTDHGQLPVWLLLSGRVPRVIASDLREKPLNNARALAHSHRLSAEQFDARLSDGLSHLQPGEAETVSICGMGGGLIARILGDAPSELGLRRLVLQPNNDTEAVRAHLMRTGWGLVDEVLVEEGRYIYPILCAEPVDTPIVYSEEALILGPLLMARRSAVWQRWVAGERSRLSAIVAHAAVRQQQESASLERLRRRVAVFASV
ncbi:MAG: class I SAM-dependent methyltransferase [Myxococcota bacterium]